MTDRMWTGLCAGHPEPDLWFDPERFEEASRICNTCPFRVECKQEAVEHKEQYGYWNSTPYERGWRHEEDGRDFVAEAGADQ